MARHRSEFPNSSAEPTKPGPRNRDAQVRKVALRPHGTGQFFFFVFFLDRLLFLCPSRSRCRINSTPPRPRYAAGRSVQNQAAGTPPQTEQSWSEHAPPPPHSADTDCSENSHFMRPPGFEHGPQASRAGSGQRSPRPPAKTAGKRTQWADHLEHGQPPESGTYATAPVGDVRCSMCRPSSQGQGPTKSRGPTGVPVAQTRARNPGSARRRRRPPCSVRSPAGSMTGTGRTRRMCVGGIRRRTHMVPHCPHLGRTKGTQHCRQAHVTPPSLDTTGR